MSDAPKPDAPKPVGPVTELAKPITGHVVPWSNAHNLPTLLAMPGSEKLYLPIFSSADACRAFMGRAGVPYSRLVQIDDERAFLGSLPADIAVILDPTHTPQGTIHYAEIVPRAGSGS
jgi:hypothetical protein